MTCRAIVTCRPKNTVEVASLHLLSFEATFHTCLMKLQRPCTQYNERKYEGAHMGRFGEALE